MIILHGDNLVQSRQQLATLMDEAKQRGLQLVRLDAKRLTEASLEEALFSDDLFGTSKLVVVEELHSLPPSKKKKALIELLAKAASAQIILWEKRLLTKTMLKPFGKARVFEHKTSNSTFKWLDSLGSKTPTASKLKLLREAVQNDSDHFCFLMLARQIRLLIQIKDGGNPAGAPYMISKLRSQAGFFSLQSLLDLHRRLLEIDLEQKSSGTRLTLGQELDLLTIKV
jgi:hypothetical protein